MKAGTAGIRSDAGLDRNTRERLELALQGAALATWDWDILTGETIYDKRWAEILGYDVHEIPSNFAAWERMVHADDRARVIQAINRHLDGSTPVYKAEYRMRHRDGKWIWILAHGRVCDRAPDGTPLRAAGIHQDITQQKEAEQALLLSREMYKNTVELTTQIPWVASVDGSIVSCDPVWERFTGLSVKDALESSWVEAVHPDDRDRMVAVWGDCLRSGTAYRVAHRLRRYDGQYRHVESRAQPQRDENGRVVRWYGTTEDIHERTVSEQLLRASEARLALALEGAELSTWDWNLRTDEIIRSAHWFEMLGYEPCVSTQSLWMERVHPDDLAMLRPRWRAHIDGGDDSFRAEYRIRDSSGEWRWIRTVGRVMERDEQGPARACGITQDITELRRAADALAASERLSRQLLDAYQDSVALLDENGFVVYENPAGINRFGTAQSPDGRRAPWIDQWCAEDRQTISQAMKLAFEGTPAGFQAYCAPAGAAPGWWDVLLSPLPAISRPQKGIVAVAREITRLKEQEAREHAIVERERLQAILENLGEGIVIAAPDSSVIMVNRAARQTYGMGAARTEMNWTDILDMCDAFDAQGRRLSIEERPLSRAANGETFSDVETYFENQTDGRHWIGSCGSTPIYDSSGELLLAVLSIRDVTLERRAADEIRRTNETLHDLSGQLLRLQDDERRRIARELHDGVVQVLSAALMNLTVLSDSEQIRKSAFERRLVSKTMNLASDCVKELRSMSYLLHPPVLDELGLVPALRSWIDGFSERTGVNVDVYLPDGLSRLAPDTETALFRITQEGLGNVHKHAEGTNAGVRLTVTDATIDLEITDDGKGFPNAVRAAKQMGNKPGVGLLGMRERAMQLGGSLLVESRKGRTSIRVSLPRTSAMK